MNEAGPAGERWRLRDGEFAERQGIVRMGGRTTELDRSCQAVLTLLLENAGAPVSKERLLEAGWPHTIVHENSLAKAVGRLREALGEAGESLKAVYGIGYKLDAAILAPAPSAERPFAEADGAPKQRLHRRRRAVALLGVSLPAALALAAFADWGWQSPSDAEKEFRKKPPVSGDAPDAVARALWVDQMRAKGDRTPAVIYTVRADTAAKQQAQRDLVAKAGAQEVAVTPEDVREVVLRIVDEARARRPE